MATTSSLAEDEATYGRSEVEPESEYTVFLRYPILYENASQDSDTNGIGALSDTLSCNVVRTRNQFPTLQLTYKRDGIYAKELQNGRIIMSDMGPDLVHQKFRINQVLKSVDNIVVNATHIAGDIAYNAITDDIQIASASVVDAFNSIINKLAEPMPDIRFDSDIAAMSGVNMKKDSGNVGNLLIDPDQEGDTQTQSLASLFKGEWTFDNYHYYLQNRGGDDTGLVVKYGRDLKTIDQDDNIANTYTAIFPYATYTPQPAKATDSNEDWNTIGGNGWSKRGTVTYVAGGTVNIYSSPVAGHQVVGTVSNGDLLDLVNEIEDGATLPDNKVVNTVNGDSWYYVENHNGSNGWINSRWITFDKSHDYVVSNGVGHYTVDIGTGNGKQTKYPFRGRGVVHYSGSYIRAYYSPFFGSDQPNSNNPGHVPVGDLGYSSYARVPTGTYVDFDYKAINEKGDTWYRIAGQPHRWLYGPHLSFSAEGTYIEDQTANGRMAVKKDAQKYVMKHGKIVPAPDKKKMVSTRTSKTKKYVQKKYYITYHGKKIPQKHTVKNKAYTNKKPVKVKTTIPKGVYKIHGQIQYNGSTYYKTGNGTYVKSGSVDWKNPMSYKPKSVESAVDKNWEQGKIEMYSEPSLGTAMNWAIPNGVSLQTGPTAHGDGEDWTYVTYEGKSGWVLTKYLKNKGADDFDSYNPDDLPSTSEDNGDDTNTDIDNQDLTVKLPELTLVAPSAYGAEVQRVQAVDLSSYFSHDYQDESGYDATTGKYNVTQKDIDQLRKLAEDYMREHNFGEPAVSLTLTAEQISDYQLDNIGLYDEVTVSFDQLGIYKTAEVNATTWDAMAHRYTEITIGDLPKTPEHLLLQAADKNATAGLNRARNESRSENQFLFSRINHALSLEGNARKEAIASLAEDLGVIQKSTEKNGKQIDVMLTSQHNFENTLTNVNNNVTRLSDDIRNGGTQVLQFTDQNGNPNFTHPTEIRAVNPSEHTYLIFNSQGLGYYGEHGLIRSAIGSDGMIAAESITAGTLNSVTINAGVIHGSLITDNGSGLNVWIGTSSPRPGWLSPDYGGYALYANSPNYISMVSSGQITVADGTVFNQRTIIRPDSITNVGSVNTNTVNAYSNMYINGRAVLSTADCDTNGWLYNKVKSWVADYITVNGKQHTIWKG